MNFISRVTIATGLPVLRVVQGTSVASFHSLNPSVATNFKNLNVLKKNSLLVVNSPLTVPSCGLKHVGEVRKLCEHCYLLYKDFRTFNYCKKFPSHNQWQGFTKDRSMFIITARTHGRKRKW